ncbi:MAG: hypothetical protein ABH891_05460 [Candidatus Omnitrophota bacterium]
MKKLKTFSALLLIFGVLLASFPVYAGTGEDIAYATRGVGKIVGSVFAIPKAMFQDSGRIMFPLGLVTGAVRGTVQTVTGVVGGVVDVARGSAPYAKYAALAL